MSAGGALEGFHAQGQAQHPSCCQHSSACSPALSPWSHQRPRSVPTSLCLQEIPKLSPQAEVWLQRGEAFEVDIAGVGAGLSCRGEAIQKEKAFILTVKLKPALAACEVRARNLKRGK